jgi:hypothetical protein
MGRVTTPVDPKAKVGAGGRVIRSVDPKGRVTPPVDPKTKGRVTPPVDPKASPRN